MNTSGTQDRSSGLELSRLQEVFKKQREQRWNLATSSAQVRQEKLDRLERSIENAKSRICDALKADLRRSETETDFLEIVPTLGEIRHAVQELPRWMEPRSVSTPITLQPGRSEVRYEAKGVSLIMGPWNYPFFLCISPLVAAIAAGCPAVIKPSELAPATSRLIADLIREVFSDEGEVAVIEGGVDVSQALLKLPFEHFFYTGGGTVGKLVMHAAAEHLSSVTLELGGKSPVILHEDVDPVEAAHRIAWGKWINAGQTCIAPDYVLVPSRLKGPFVQALHQQVKNFYGETAVAQKESPDFARLIHERHFQRVQVAIESSVASGAVVEFGRDYEVSQKYIAPTVLTSVRPDHAIMKEEIFGPVLPVIEYERERDALELIRSQEKPLALYLFSKCSQWIERMLHSTTSGGVTTNHVTLHVANPHLPFGGVGASGLGNYHGEYGFKAFSHERAVFHAARQFSPLKWFLPPYSGGTQRLIRWVKKVI